MFQPLSLRLQESLCFLRFPLPAALSPFLTIGFPLQESNRLTTFRVNPLCDVGPAYYAERAD